MDWTIFSNNIGDVVLNEIPASKSSKNTLITKKLALVAIFTALVTVATVVLYIPLPVAGGYFNLGEAMVYLAALLLGPYAGAFAGGIGAMLGDLLLGAAAYAPGTLVIKALEGFITGFIFSKMKARYNEQQASTGKSTIHILLSGFLIAAAVIIIGVNIYAEYTIFWIIIGSAFICLAFLSILLGKIPLYYIILSMVAGMAIMTSGYQLYYFFVMHNPLPYFNLPFDTLQCLIGMVISLPVYQALQKAEIAQKI
jgi:uncharacterized membrane protein